MEPRYVFRTAKKGERLRKISVLPTIFNFDLVVRPLLQKSFEFQILLLFQNFSIILILREIYSGDSRGAKSTILTRLEALNFDILNFCIFLKAEI